MIDALKKQTRANLMQVEYLNMLKHKFGLKEEQMLLQSQDLVAYNQENIQLQHAVQQLDNLKKTHQVLQEINTHDNQTKQLEDSIREYTILKI